MIIICSISIDVSHMSPVSKLVVRNSPSAVLFSCIIENIFFYQNTKKVCLNNIAYTNTENVSSVRTVKQRNTMLSKILHIDLQFLTSDRYTQQHVLDQYGSGLCFLTKSSWSEIAQKKQLPSPGVLPLIFHPLVAIFHVNSSIMISCLTISSV